MSEKEWNGQMDRKHVLGKAGRKALALCMAGAMAVGCSGSGGVLAAEAPADSTGESAEQTVCASFTAEADTSSLADNGTLFEGYVERILYGEDSSLQLYSADYAATVLDDVNYLIYSELKTAVEEIAAGERTSTIISLSDDIVGSSGLFSWSYSELGLSSFNSMEELQASIDDISDGVSRKLATLFDLQQIASCLEEDCPYELYWFDETSTVSVTSDMSVALDYCYITSMTVTFYVSADYRDGNSTTTVDATEVNRAKSAAATAKEIVRTHAAETDMEKLESYKEEICSLVSYNDEAADNPDELYGDPWQLIYVFDGDNSTNVVCEGYSRAFKYLCEMSDFEDSVVCYTVTGVLGSDTDTYEEHMWNIVSVGTANYFVDVTNSDSGTPGQDGGLFLVTDQDALAYTAAESYTFRPGSVAYTYTYDTATQQLFGTDILTLRESEDDDTTGGDGGSGDTDSGDGSGDTAGGDADDGGNNGDDTSITGDTLMVRRGTTMFFNYTLKGGNADFSISAGLSTDQVLVGDWDGDGVDTICLRRGNVCYFIDDITTMHVYLTVTYGRSGDEVLVGDWDGDGCDSLAMRRNGNYYFFCNDITNPDGDTWSATYGRVADEVHVGDWEGRGYDSLAVRRDGNYYYFSLSKVTDPDGDVWMTTFGRAGDEVLVGDWDANGTDTLAMRRDGNSYFISNSISNPDSGVDTFTFGRASDEVYAGKWK
ncbi:MAG: hypothetical protein LUG27_10985 [Clostridiales bacterium]|nr:hypothetical protein [Clostridiales bacterium]